MYDVDIKAEYSPKEVYEDFVIERILNKSFRDGRLEYQKAANPISLDYLMLYWKKKKETPETR